MTFINKLFNYDTFTLRFYKRIIYAITIFYFISQVFSFNTLYARDLLHVSMGCKSSLLTLLSCYPSSLLIYTTFAMFLFLGIINLIKDYFVCRLIFWLLLINLFNLNVYILDGGNNLISIVTFFLIFAFSSNEVDFLKSKSWFLKDLTGLSILMIKLQIILIYFNSGVSKAASVRWQNGTALYYTLTNPEYSIPFVISNIGKIPLPLLIVPAYILILFQIFLGPILISKSTRKLGLLSLLLFHLFIFIVMGLGYFALFMIASHFIFYDRLDLIKLSRIVKNIINRSYFFPWSLYAKKRI